VNHLYNSHMAPNKLVVVGSSGFLGSAITSSISNADYQVVGLNRIDPAWKPKGGISPKLMEAEQVVWSASRVNPSRAVTHPEEAEMELKEFVAVIAEMEKSKELQKFVFLSSGGCAYSGNSIPFTEMDEAEGNNPYGRLKSTMEKFLFDSNLPYVVLRVANVYGPKQPTGRGQGVIAEWLNAIKQHTQPSLIGPSSYSRDFLYIDDFVEAMHSVIRSKIDREIINIGSGVSTSLNDIMMIFSELTKCSFEVKQLQPRSIDRPHYWLDISKAERLLDWGPKTSIKTGIETCLNTFELTP
jgi:UDP-glucose 4-epimerase